MAGMISISSPDLRKVDPEVDSSRARAPPAGEVEGGDFSHQSPGSPQGAPRCCLQPPPAPAARRCRPSFDLPRTFAPPLYMEAKFAYIRSPAACDFSGWNWQATRLSR